MISLCSQLLLFSRLCAVMLYMIWNSFLGIIYFGLKESFEIKLTFFRTLICLHYMFELSTMMLISANCNNIIMVLQYCIY
jgi:hypothetical protein